MLDPVLPGGGQGGSHVDNAHSFPFVQSCCVHFPSSVSFSPPFLRAQKFRKSSEEEELDLISSEA